MVKINPPGIGMKEESQGSVTLHYLGQQENFHDQNVVNNSKLKIEYFKSTAGCSVLFQIEFQEFFQIPLFLNLIDRKLYLDGNLSMPIGVLWLEMMRLENSTFLISGRYFHNAITLAYHNFKYVKFECEFQINKKKKYVKIRLENMKSNVAELHNKIELLPS